MATRKWWFGCMLFVVHFGATQAIAQDNVRFLEESYDFGEVKEGDGSVEHIFYLINTSEAQMTVQEVNADCGCTTPEWTGEAIMPGDTGFIIAQYNPLNRPGRFEKELRVAYTIGEGAASVKTLRIKGMVKPKPKTIEEELPTVMGQVRVKFKSLNMGRMTNDQPVASTFSVYNDGDSAISWLPERSDLPTHISVVFEPELLAPKSMGEIKLTYDPELKDDLGFLSDNIKLYTSEGESAEKEFHVITTLSEYFPPMTEEELAAAPRLEFDQVVHDFGKVNQGTTVVTTFELTNTGMDDLLIRKVKPNCGCTTTNLNEQMIPAGDSLSMELSFDTSGRKGRQYKTVTIFSNDPTASSQMITIKAEIVD